MSVLGIYAMVRESELYQEQRRRAAAERWTLPRRRKRRRSPEDDCRHCTGTGACADCAPQPCRVCNGNGLQPHDAAIASRLTAIWNPGT